MIEYPEINIEFQGSPVEVTRDEGCTWPVWNCVVKSTGFKFVLETDHRHLVTGEGYWSTGTDLLDRCQSHDGPTPQSAVDNLIEHMAVLRSKLAEILGA